MQARCALIILGLSLTGAMPAFAATQTGWISYISEDGHQLMLNSSDMFTLGPAASLSGVAIGDQVKLTSERRAGEKIITKIVKVPFDPTAS